MVSTFASRQGKSLAVQQAAKPRVVTRSSKLALDKHGRRPPLQLSVSLYFSNSMQAEAQEVRRFLRLAQESRPRAIMVRTLSDEAIAYRRPPLQVRGFLFAMGGRTPDPKNRSALPPRGKSRIPKARRLLRPLPELRHSPFSASSNARRTARALFWHSLYSRAATESATMPAPACR